MRNGTALAIQLREHVEEMWESAGPVRRVLTKKSSIILVGKVIHNPWTNCIEREKKNEQEDDHDLGQEHDYPKACDNSSMSGCAQAKTA